MSSRHDNRRRDRSWERDERDRDRYSRGGQRGGYRDAPRRPHSRSRSPHRGERERRGAPDRRDYGREDERRDRDRDRDRDKDRDRDRRDGRRREPDDVRRDSLKREGDRDRERDRERDGRRGERPREVETKERVNTQDLKDGPSTSQGSGSKPPGLRPNLDPDAPEEGDDEGMDAVNEDDDAMMAMMGLKGFGSTKGTKVEGNQEGTVDVKKMRTWRQYMNRRGGFNRPLDKIK